MTSDAIERDLQARTAEVLRVSVATQNLRAESTAAVARMRRVRALESGRSLRNEAEASLPVLRISECFQVMGSGGKEMGWMSELTRGDIRTYWFDGIPVSLEVDGGFTLPSGERYFRITAEG